MLTLDAHTQFYARTRQLANEFSAIEHDVSQREQWLLDQIRSLTDRIKKGAQIKQPEIVKTALAQYYQRTSEVLSAWERKVARYDAGLRFSKQFGDSLLVFVYGKVKGGKSQLGNFMATGRCKPDAAWMDTLAKSLHTPEFFGGERNEAFGEAINLATGFRVGETETTSGIQGFTVPGLTWVDSPGLHSVNPENGELAQKYVESADLIIYPMNTANPGRESDFQEIGKLLDAGKRLLVVITRCDLEEPDEENGQIVYRRVMKTDAARRDQELYVQAGLDKLCSTLGIQNANTNVISVSVTFAEENGNTAEALQASGVQRLFNALTQIIDSDAITLKKQVPDNNLQAFYRALLSSDNELSLKRLTTPLNDALQQLDQLEKELDAIEEQARTRIHYHLSEQMDTLVDAHAGQRDVKALEKDLSVLIEGAIEDHYRAPMQNLYQNALGTLTGLTTNLGLCTGVSFNDKTAEIVVDISGRVGATTTGIGAVVGGVGGFFLLSPFGLAPLGSMVGSTVGGWLGNKSKHLFTTKQRKTITVGDNREEIKGLLINKCQSTVNSLMSHLKQHAREEILGPMRKALLHVNNDTITFEHTIEEQLHV